MLYQRTKKIILVFISLLFLQYSYSEPVAETLSELMQNNTYDLREVYNISQENNAQYLAAKSILECKYQNVKLALGELLPKVNMTYDINEDNYYSGNPKHLASITLTQSIFNLRDWNRYNYTKSQAQVDGIDFAIIQKDLISKVIKTYFNVLQAQDYVKYTKANFLWIQLFLNQIEERHNFGLSTNAEIQLIKAQYETALAKNIQAENDLIASYDALAYIAGKPIKSIKALSSQFKIEMIELRNIEEWLKISLEKNDTIVYSHFLLESSKRAVLESWGKFIPEMYLIANISAKSNQHRDASIGIRMGWNILNGGSDYALLKAKKYNEQAYKYQLLDNQQEVERQVKKIYLTMISDLARLKAYKQNVIAAEVSVQDMKVNYELGKCTIVDFLNQQQYLLQVQQEYAYVKYAYISDLIDLKKTAGTLNSKDIDMINEWLMI